MPEPGRHPGPDRTEADGSSAPVAMATPMATPLRAVRSRYSYVRSDDNRLRVAITAALEAVEAGDQALAVEILLGALEDGLVCDPEDRRRRCPECGLGPLWPGQLEQHRLVVHLALPEAA